MELKFCDRKMTDEYCEKLQAILGSNISLRCLTCTLYRKEGITALANALKVNSSMTSLYIIRDSKEESNLLVRMLEMNFNFLSLFEIDLSFTSIRSEGALVIC